ncbi:MAG: hypothetical protein JXJ04_14290 [Spirochaetales bacterium]|nr:hypothetical protein [Spirochaetales bacterium]
MRKYVFYVSALFILSLILMGCFGIKKFNNETIVYASDKAAYYSFGQALSLSGEYLIVGAGATNSKEGQVHIFKNKGNNNWNETAILTASDKENNAFFGNSVALSGDHAVVGAPGSHSESGQVYVFKRNDTDNWKEVSILTSTSPIQINKHFFGISVAMYEDYVIVGANSMGEDKGTAYIFKNDGADNWNQVAELGSGDTIITDNFGYSVAIYKDYAIVGAPKAESGGKNRGQTYLFKNDGADNWKEIAILTASDQADEDYFGRIVSIYENYAVIGAPLHDSGGMDRGQVYIFKNDGADTWLETTRLKGSHHYDKNYFGHSLAIFDKHIIVGAPGSFSGSGQVFIFKNVGADNWKEIDNRKPENKSNFHGFGVNVSITGEYASTSAFTLTPEGEKRGQAYIYH